MGGGRRGRAAKAKNGRRRYGNSKQKSVEEAIYR
jgi:hypothetical protein